MSTAKSEISSYTKYSAKSQSTNAANQNNPNGAGGAYGQKSKQQMAQELELEEDDIIKRYMEQQEKHKQLMLQNAKRRKEQEKKQKEELEKKKKQEEEELMKRKETKQSAYLKFLRSNATKVADNLKQNKNNNSGSNANSNQVKTKSSTANQQKRPTYTVTQVEQNKTVTSDLSKPKKQWNTGKSNVQNQTNVDKVQSQKENRVPVPLEEYYLNQKQSQNTDKNKIQQEIYGKEMNLDALDLNIPSRKDDFEKIKNMYAKQKQEVGNEFIVNFEKEWNDDDDSLEVIRQSKLLESLDLSTVQKRKNKNIVTEQIQPKQQKKTQSQFDHIQENDSYDENDYEKEQFDEFKDQKKNNKITAQQLKPTQEDKPSRAQLQQQIKLQSGQNNTVQEQKAEMKKAVTKLKQSQMKNESALVREAIGFDEDILGADSDDDDIGTALGFQQKRTSKNKVQEEKKEKVINKEKEDSGLTEETLQKHNEIMEGTISLENQKYDVLSWAKNQQKEVEDVFSHISGQASNITHNKIKPVSAKQTKDDKKPPIVRSNTNNNLPPQNQQINQQKKQAEQDLKSQISEDKIQRQNIRQLSAQKNTQKQELSSARERQQSSDRSQIIQQQSNQQNKTKIQNDKSKERQQPVLQIPASKQKYQNIHQNKQVQNHDTTSDVASSNQGRVSKFKQKLQWNVQQNRKNQSKSPGSVGTRDEDINVEEFLRDDLVNINKEEQQLQKEIYALHFDNIEKIRDVQSRNNINLNLVSSKQIKDLENNPSTIIKPIKPIYEYKEDELEQSLLRLDKALAKKANKPQSASLTAQINPQQSQGYQQNFNEQKSIQMMYQVQQQQNNQQVGYNQNINQMQPPNLQEFQNVNNLYMQQQQLQQQQQQMGGVPNNLIAQQLMILQQQQQLLLQQQQQIAVTQLQNQNTNNIGLNPPPILQNQVNTMKIQQIINANQLNYQNLAEQHDSLTKLEQNYSQEVGQQGLSKKLNKVESRDQVMYVSPQFGMINNSKRDSLLNNNIKNVTGNVSVTSLHGQQQQQQSQYSYDINDLQSISQVNSVAPSNNPEIRRQKLKDELDEEVESKISEMKSKISSKQEKEQGNSYKQKHIIKKEIKQKKVAPSKEEKDQQKELEDNADGIIKFAGNNKLKALLLDNVEEEDDSRHYQDNSYE